jgi:diguanylate cyclase (GGDEF)-like protein
VAPPDEDARLFAVRPHGGIDEIVLSVLSCARSESYRGTTTALVAAAIRYGAYDRAIYAKWNPATARLTLRGKADSSARRLAVSSVQPTPNEIAGLQRALATERPARIGPAGVRGGLLDMLSVDEALLVPMNRGFATPALLILDRSLSMQPIQPLHDDAMALTLGMIGSLLNENLLSRRRRQRAQKFALTDPLTRLYNRRMGLVALEQEVARVQRAARPLTVLMCDLDHFKRLNDTHGHLQGDAALRATADVLRHTMRRTDTICRFGGEEFLLVLPDTGPEDAAVLAARLFTTIERRGIELGLPVTVSIGLTSYRPGDSVEALLVRADHALYASKDRGRNRFCVDLEDSAPPVNLPTPADSSLRS